MQAVITEIGGLVPGKPGSAGIIFRPGLPSAGVAVATWAEVQTAIIAADGAITVFIDGQNAACHVPASSGVTDCQGATLFQSYNLLAGVGAVAQQTLTIDDGAVLHRPRAIVQVDIVCACATTSAITFNTTSPPTDTLVTNYMGLSLAAGATVPAISIGAGGQLNILSEFSSTFDSSLAGTTPVISLGTGATLNWVAFGTVVISGTDPVTGGGLTATIDFTHDDMTQLPNFVGFGFTGTVTEFRASFAGVASPAQGNTAGRPVPPLVYTGQIYFDTTLQALVAYTGAGWVTPVGGTAPVNVTNGVLSFGAGTVAASGALRFGSAAATFIAARNVANTADVALIGIDGANDIIIGDTTHPPTIQYEATSSHLWYIGGTSQIIIQSAQLRATTDNTVSLGVSTQAWSAFFTYAVTFPAASATAGMTQTALASTAAGSGAAGQVTTVAAQAGQAATGAAHNGGAGGNLNLTPGPGGTSGAATAGAGGKVVLNGGLQVQQVTKSATYAVDSGTTADNVIFMTGNAFTATLPAPTAGRVLKFKDAAGNATTQNKTISQHAAETIDGAATYVLSGNWDCVELTSDGTNWFVTAEYNGTVI
jgi:hypothetical protein